MSAKQSPTAKVPYMVDGEIRLTDSSAILKYVREKSGQAFLADVLEYDSFAMVNTLMDACINLFLIENDGYGPQQIGYLARQKQRIETGLVELNQRFDSVQDIRSDAVLRCGCFLGWALFRNRINIDSLPKLQQLLQRANDDPLFKATAPYA